MRYVGFINKNTIKNWVEVGDNVRIKPKHGLKQVELTKELAEQIGNKEAEVSFEEYGIKVISLKERESDVKELSEIELLGQSMTDSEIESMEQGQQITDMEIRLLALEANSNG